MIRVAMFMTASLRVSPSGTYTPALVELVDRISRNIDLTVFTVVPPTGETEPYICGNARVVVVPVRYDVSLIHRTYSFCRAFLALHRQRAFDIVHGFWALPGGGAAVASGRITGVPSVVTIQGGEAASLPSINYGNMSRLSTRQITLSVCRHATSLVALTRFQADAMRSYGLKSGMTIIPYGAAASFYCNRIEQQLHAPIRFLHVSDLNRVKDQETLLRAFKLVLKNVDAELTIAGRDLLDGAGHQLAVELGIKDKVCFLGYVHQDRLPALYSSADIFVHTPLYEAQGVVVAEACAAGCVIVGTRVGLLADLTDNGAVTVPTNDPQACADAILSVIKDPVRYRQVQSAARAWAASHTAAWTADQYFRLYSDLSNF